MQRNLSENKLHCRTGSRQSVKCILEDCRNAVLAGLGWLLPQHRIRSNITVSCPQIPNQPSEIGLYSLSYIYPIKTFHSPSSNPISYGPLSLSPSIVLWDPFSLLFSLFIYFFALCRPILNSYCPSSIPLRIPFRAEMVEEKNCLFTICLIKIMNRICVKNTIILLLTNNN